MNRLKFAAFALLVLALASFGCRTTEMPTETEEEEQENPDQGFALGKHAHGGRIVVANRAGGTISIINTRTDVVDRTIALPSGPNTPEPMYVVWARRAGRLFVGDRANNCIVVMDDRTYDKVAFVPVGAGVFHMWMDPGERQLWVNNDIDKTASVIDPRTLHVLATVPMPGDLVARGGKPHDVTLVPHAGRALVSILGVSGGTDYVVQFSTKTFRETARAAAGKDPHLAMHKGRKLAFVAAQNTSEVLVFDARSLGRSQSIQVPGAHGAAFSPDGRTFYTTNLPGGGPDGLYAIDVHSKSVIGSVDTPFPVPHNIALPPGGNKLYLTHSGGAADKVSVYRIDRHTRLPYHITDITVGLNPYGLTFAR